MVIDPASRRDRDTPATPVGARCIGDDLTVLCVDGVERVSVNLDAGASTPALDVVGAAVFDLLPWYSSVHRGAGAKSQFSTDRYEAARDAVLRFSGGRPDDMAVLCRNTTEAINIAAHRLGLKPGDTVVTTVAEHHANLLPWQRLHRDRGIGIRWVECDRRGMFDPDDVIAALEAGPPPALLAITGAANVTGWMPDVEPAVDAAHRLGARVLLDAAQLAPHRPLHTAADLIAWSGHKMYAPFGTGALVGPADLFAEGDPLIVGGGAVRLVDLDDVVWADAPDREEAGSPNVVGAVALAAAIEWYEATGWESIVAHERAQSKRLRRGLGSITGVHLLGPDPADVDADDSMLAVGAFNVAGLDHPLLAARLSAEYGIAVRHGCFCAHPYLVRLLGLDAATTARYRADIVAGDRRNIPGAVRASATITTTDEQIDSFLAAVADLAAGKPAPVSYHQDPATGDYSPVT
ncbi:MAG: aminotransferase class V-fold PLP-dependent enzyme [Microthrixaceae bacterium]